MLRSDCDKRKKDHHQPLRFLAYRPHPLVASSATLSWSTQIDKQLDSNKADLLPAIATASRGRANARRTNLGRSEVDLGRASAGARARIAGRIRAGVRLGARDLRREVAGLDLVEVDGAGALAGLGKWDCGGVGLDDGGCVDGGGHAGAGVGVNRDGAGADRVDGAAGAGDHRGLGVG